MVRANSASNISTFLRKFGGCLTSHTAALGLGNNAARHSGAFPAEHGFLLSGYRLSLRCPRASLCSPGSPSCTTDAAWRLCEAMQRGFGAVHLAVPPKRLYCVVVGWLDLSGAWKHGGGKAYQHAAGVQARTQLLLQLLLLPA